MIHLALIRHGHTPWNRAGRIQGRTDIPLDADTASDVARLELPPPWNSAALVASPLKRAQDTAALIGSKVPTVVPALIEMDWGSWEGKTGQALLDDPTTGYKHIEDWGWHYRPPGGESPQEVLARVKPWVDGLRDDTVAVCHIGIMRVILAVATGWRFQGSAPFRIKRNRLYVITVSSEGWHLIGDPIRLKERSA